MVYSCLEDKMYKARKGKGAFCNDEPIQVSDVKGKNRIHILIFRLNLPCIYQAKVLNLSDLLLL